MTERDRRRSRVFVEDFATEERPREERGLILELNLFADVAAQEFANTGIFKAVDGPKRVGAH